MEIANVRLFTYTYSSKKSNHIIQNRTLATKIGGKKMMGLGIFITAILTMLVPFVTCGKFTCQHHDVGTANVEVDGESDTATAIWPLLLLRFFMGLSESVVFPAFYVLINSWAPTFETSRIVTMYACICIYINIHCTKLLK